MIGSILPDLHYFLFLGTDAKWTHTLAGAFYFCLPLGLALLWLFHYLLKLPLISLLPESQQSRFARFAGPFSFGPAKRLGLVVTSLLTGIFSHLLWDAFTHPRSWIVQHLPILRTAVLERFGIHRPAWNLLQYGTTVAGVAVLAMAYRTWARSAGKEPIPANLRLNPVVKTRAALGITFCACAAGAAYAFNEFGSARLPIVAAYAFIPFTTIGFLGVFSFSLWWHNQSRRSGSNA